jgi:hypothetical protein
MVHPGAFLGSRKDFLTGEKSNFRAAVLGGFAKDTIADIQRRYFKRFPIDLPHSEEPSAEYLASINDSEPDPEPSVPEKENTRPRELRRSNEDIRS